MKNGAMVIGGHFQGLGAIRALGRKGIPVFLVDSEFSLSRFSKYVTASFKSPPVLNERAFIDFLLKLAQKENVKGSVIYPTDDETVAVLSKYKPELSKVYRVFTPGWDAIQYAYNKKLSYQLADKLGIPIPKTWYPESIIDIESFEGAFPVIVKPAVMRSFFRVTGKKVYRATNRNELVTAYQKASEVIPQDEILIQDEIPEVSKNLFSYCPVFKDGRSLAHIVAQRPRQHPMDFGQASTYATTVEVPELVTLGNRFLKEIQYYGLGEVEFIRDPRDGEFKFLEINPRIWGWHTIAQAAGVNIPYILYRDMHQMQTHFSGYRLNVKWMRLITDMATVLSEILKGKMTFSDYLKTWTGTKEFAVLSKDDPMPFWGELAMLPYLWMKRGF